MQVTFVEYSQSDQDEIVRWLTSETWEYFETPSPTQEMVVNWVSNGHFHGEQARSFWIQSGIGENVGFITVFEIRDPIPRIALRISAPYRRMGIGKQALHFIADFVFREFPAALRIEGNTRQDNIAMRKTFAACGWVKESHYRALWKTETGEYATAIGYAIIKQDWLNGTVTAVDWNDEP